MVFNRLIIVTIKGTPFDGVMVGIIGEIAVTLQPEIQGNSIRLNIC